MHSLVADEETRRLLNGIIADFHVGFSSAATSPPLGEGVSGTDLGGSRIHFDCKALACGATYKEFRSKQLDKRKAFRIEEFSRRVDEDYEKAARALDRKTHGTARGKVGLIEAKLCEYGKTHEPNAHAAAGLVLGAFGELSTSC